MGKKSQRKKMMLGRRLRQKRMSLPVLATLRTHRRKTHNKFYRDWRHRKLKIRD